MNYVDAAFAPLRKTGQIKLHGAAGFAGMRKAGALVSKCLDELTDVVKPGVKVAGCSPRWFGFVIFFFINTIAPFLST